MKKVLASLLALVCLLGVLSGCGSKQKSNEFVTGVVPSGTEQRPSATENTPTTSPSLDEFNKVQGERTPVDESLDNKPADIEQPVEDSSAMTGAWHEVLYEKWQIHEGYSGPAFSAMWAIKNVGTLPLRISSIDADFESPDGRLLSTYSTDFSMFSINSLDVILPGEVSYVYVDGASLDGDISVDSDVVMKPQFKLRESTYDNVHYEVSDVSLTGEDDKATVVGRVTNPTNKDGWLVRVSVVLFDKNDIPFGIARTYVDNLEAGDRASFKLNISKYDLDWVDFKFDDIARYEVYAQQ